MCLFPVYVTCCLFPFFSFSQDISSCVLLSFLFHSSCPLVCLLSFLLPPLAPGPAGRHILPRSNHPCSPSKSLLSWLCSYPTQQEFSFKQKKGGKKSAQLPPSWHNASPGIFSHFHQQPSLALSPTPLLSPPPTQAHQTQAEALIFFAPCCSQHVCFRVVVD